MNTKVYKWCVVPQCTNTSIKAPTKLFIYVPHKKSVRDKWLSLARRDPATIRMKSTIYMCEDHFDLPQDMDNYMEYHLMGLVSIIRMKPGCIPTKFDCQQDRKSGTPNTIERPFIIKKRRTMVMQECENTQHSQPNHTPTERPGIMAEIKTEVPDDSEMTGKTEDPSSTMKLEYPLNLDDNLIKIEEIKIEPCDEIIVKNEVYSPTHCSGIMAEIKTEVPDDLPMTWKCEGPSFAMNTTDNLIQFEEIKLEASDTSIVKNEVYSSFTHRSDMAEIKTEIPDDGQITWKTENPNSAMQLEYPLKLGDNLLAIEQPKLDPSDERIVKTEECFPGTLRSGSSEKNPPFECKYFVENDPAVKPHRCVICGETFGEETSYKIHLKKHVRCNIYKCDICPKTFHTACRLVNHKMLHKALHRCDVCGEKFKVKQSLLVHKRTHSGRHPYKCDMCTRTFSGKSNLESHKRTHADQLPQVCELCEMEFPCKYKLMEHMRVHTGERLYYCDICHKTFCGKNIIELHRRTHTGARPYNCDVCEKKFARSSGLLRHKRTHTAERTTFSCGVCRKTFSLRESFVLHMRTHTGDRPFRCEVCARAYTRLSALQNHKLIHSHDQSANNDACNQVRQKATAQMDERPFVCEVCDREFTRNSYLVSHQRIHSAERPHGCDMCEERFTCKKRLKKHRATHMLTQMFKCDMCERKFARNNSLLRRQQGHWGVQLYRCDECDEMVNRKQILANHKQTHAIIRVRKGVCAENSLSVAHADTCE